MGALSRRRHPALAPLASCAAVAALLGGAGLIAECLLRRSVPAPAPLSAEYIRFLEESERPFFRLERTEAGEELVSQPRAYLVVTDQRLPPRPAPGTLRLLVVGESSAHLLGRELRDSAEGSAPRVEVMNYGVGAGSLEIVARRFDEAMQHDPGAVLLAFGHNLFYRHPRFPSLMRITRRSRLLGLLGEQFAGVSDPAREASRRLAALEGLARRVARSTRARGLPVLVVALPSNLWVVPASSRADRSDARYNAALYEHLEGREGEALAGFRRAAAERPNAFWEFAFADWLRVRRKAAEAREHLIAARELDPARMRAGAAVNTLLRRVAVEEGVAFFDAEDWTTRRAPNRTPGWESFADQQHAHPALIRGWAIESLRLLGVSLPSAPASPPRALGVEAALRQALGMLPLDDVSSRTSLVYFCEARLDELARLDEDRLTAAVPEPERRGVVALSLAEAFWRAGRRKPAFAANEQASRLLPGSSEPAFQRGSFHLRAGFRKAAAAAFADALRLEPGRPDAKAFVHFLAGS